jgi:hypothetical protein
LNVSGNRSLGDAMPFDMSNSDATPRNLRKVATDKGFF